MVNMKATGTISDMPKANGNRTGMADFISRAIDLEEEIAGEVTEMLILKAEIGLAINSLPTPELRTVLELRYLACNTWQEIADSMHFSVRYLHKLHARALAQIGTAISGVHGSSLAVH